MGLNYRKAMTPGLKACKDYYEGKKSSEKKEEIKTKPNNYKLDNLKK